MDLIVARVFQRSLQLPAGLINLDETGLDAEKGIINIVKDYMATFHVGMFETEIIYLCFRQYDIQQQEQCGLLEWRTKLREAVETHSEWTREWFTSTCGSLGGAAFHIITNRNIACQRPGCWVRPPCHCGYPLNTQ